MYLNVESTQSFSPMVFFFSFLFLIHGHVQQCLSAEGEKFLCEAFPVTIPFVTHTSLSFYRGVKRYSGTDQHINNPYLRFYETSHSSINMASSNARRVRTMKRSLPCYAGPIRCAFRERLTLYL